MYKRVPKLILIFLILKIRINLQTFILFSSGVTFHVIRLENSTEFSVAGDMKGGIG